jgi:putative transposase
VMPRTSRAALGGICYHVINRGNGRTRVYHKDEDYAAFIRLLARADEKVAMRLVGFCLLPTHFHLVAWPREDGDLSRWMQWLLTAHVRRHHRHHGTSGHVWQGRFKAFPIQLDAHLLTVLRYVEANPLRVGLVERAQDWPWSSLREKGDVLLFPDRAPPGEGGAARLELRLDPGPVPKPRGWVAAVNRPLPETRVRALRESLFRGRPYGNETWTARIARRLGIESSLNARGRPRKEDKK